MTNREYPEDTYFCSVCGKPFTKFGDKLRHTQNEHSDYGTPYATVPEEANDQDVKDVRTEIPEGYSVPSSE